MEDLGHAAVALAFGPLVLGVAWLGCAEVGGAVRVAGLVQLGLGVALLAAVLGTRMGASPAVLALREGLAGLLVMGGVAGGLWVTAVCGG